MKDWFRIITINIITIPLLELFEKRKNNNNICNTVSIKFSTIYDERIWVPSLNLVLEKCKLFFITIHNDLQYKQHVYSLLFLCYPSLLTSFLSFHLQLLNRQHQYLSFPLGAGFHVEYYQFPPSNTITVILISLSKAFNK